MDLILIVLGAIGSALLGFGLSYISQRLSYKDEYYKKIIDKRIHMYELVETLATQMKLWLNNDADGKLYHSIFHTWDEFQKFYTSLLVIMANELWLSKELIKKLREVNRVLWFIYIQKFQKENSKLVGIDNYDKFVLFSQELENLLYSDFKKLHKVSNFLKEKEYVPNTSENY